MKTETQLKEEVRAKYSEIALQDFLSNRLPKCN
ncbi:hypothetical protein BH09BAC2_BH09BAC2_13880 [soil metagenome]